MINKIKVQGNANVDSNEINLLLECLYKEYQATRKALGSSTMRSGKRNETKGRMVSIKVLQTKLLALNGE